MSTCGKNHAIGVVMERVYVGDEACYEAQVGTERLYITSSTFDSFPEHITVTIDPGDKL